MKNHKLIVLKNKNHMIKKEWFLFSCYVKMNKKE